MLMDLPDYHCARVLVVGDVMLDRYWHGKTARISPEAPVPVVQVQAVKEFPGGAGNVALNLATLTVPVSLHGITGHDEAAVCLEAKFAEFNIPTQLHRITDYQTITKLRVISLNQQLLRMDFEDPAKSLDTTALQHSFCEGLADTQVLILSDYGKGTIQDPQFYIQHARNAGVQVFIDPKGRDFTRYRGATLLTPNRKEFEWVMGACRDEAELIAKGEHAIQEHDLGGLLITRGEQGMTLLQRDKPPVHLPAHAREVYDVTGAGDTVIAVLAASVAAGCDLETAMLLSNLAAGIVVTKLGAASVSVSELRRALQTMQGTHSGVISQAQLQTVLHDARQHHEKIVMTNGCFDLLHAGHVAYLAQAKKLGDRLCVLVNDDDSVRALKGSGRPVNPLQRRMEVLAALETVDWVVPFSENTPERLINAALPDVLVKGGDYKVEDIAGAKAVLANGGNVKILGFEDGCSTTHMIENILETTV